MESGRIEQVLTETVLPYFAGQADRITREFLLSPERLTLILQRFGSRMPPPPVRLPTAGAVADTGWPRWRRRLCGLRATKENTAPILCQSTRRVRQFRRFSQIFPSPGMLVGTARNGFWLTPLRAEWQGAAELPQSGDQLLFAFRLAYADGQQGEAGFIDRWRERDGFRRLHVFPDGRVASSESYPHQRLNHDVFRTLMGLLLLLEAIPAAGAFIKTLRPCATPPPPAITAIAGAPTAPADGRVPFKLIRLPERRTSDLPPANPAHSERRICH